VIQLTEREGFHPALAPLMALWKAGELAVIQGVGYPSPNFSHFRSIDIWDTASRADEYLNEGWLARTFAGAGVPKGFAAEGVVVGAQEMGPLSGSRSIALIDPDRFQRQAKLAMGDAPAQPRSAALAHVLRVEADIVQASLKLASGASRAPRRPYPAGPLGNALRVATDVIENGSGVAAIKLSLNGFDTHQNQPGIHANLLRQVGEGLAAFRHTLVDLKRWDSTLVMTYAEFGRRPAENGSGGTDHGTAGVHFMAGGQVKGGLYGEAPRLDRLENGNLSFAVDFRSLYATVLDRWWGLDSRNALKGRFAPLDLLRA
jgi:uncharacterized protein (DUF1501 family)